VIVFATVIQGEDTHAYVDPSAIEAVVRDGRDGRAIIVLASGRIIESTEFAEFALARVYAAKNNVSLTEAHRATFPDHDKVYGEDESEFMFGPCPMCHTGNYNPYRP